MEVFKTDKSFMATLKFLPPPPSSPIITRMETEFGRFYNIKEGGDPKGFWLPSATTVLAANPSSGLKEWIERTPANIVEFKSRIGAGRGSDFHMLAERYLQNHEVFPDKTEVIHPVSKALFKKAIPTLDRIDNILGIEQFLYTRELGIAGAYDCLAEFDGELAIIDFKTASRRKQASWIKSYFAQTFIYATAIQEHYPLLKIRKSVILIASDDGFVELFITDPFTNENRQYVKDSKEAFGHKIKAAQAARSVY